ncbi:YhgE/Pip domain-containing protein [Brevibacillus sp. B_LB10_24]|uniref:YhgE/Pip domain-containing protein n=1 Tax=Brevibacillus sp. B_LB10_24 TaxID=3380645 RepID=UPI0038B875DA
MERSPNIGTSSRPYCREKNERIRTVDFEVGAAESQAHNLPIAIVNEDQGLTTSNVNMGETVVSSIQSATSANSDGEPAMKWIEVGSEEEVKAGLDNQEYYAAFVIPKDFSKKQASLMTPDPSSPRVRIYVNQGMNASASSMAGEMLNQAISGINEEMRTELLATFDQQGAAILTKQAAALASPIVSEVIQVNAIGTHSANGNSLEGLRELFFFGQRLRMNHPTFVLIWIGTCGLLVFLLFAFKRSRKPEQKKEA